MVYHLVGDERVANPSKTCEKFITITSLRPGLSPDTGNSGQSVLAELIGIGIVNTTTIVSPSSVSQPPMIQFPDPQSNLQVSIQQGATHLLI